MKCSFTRLGIEPETHPTLIVNLSKIQVHAPPKLSALALFAVAACFALTPTARVHAAARPNVLVILTDDQGWSDIGYNNPGKVHTPNLDRLAAGGAKFENHYVMPQCTPTRVALFTGRYPSRFGRAPLQATNETCFPPGTPTLATLLKSSGYETFLSGKWHMGSAPEDGPNRHGFDYSYGSIAGAVGMYQHTYREGGASATWHRNQTIIPGYENGRHATDLVAAEAIRVIREERDQPFLIYLAFHAPHTPLDERGRFTERPTQLDPQNPNRWLNEDQIDWFNDPQGIIQKEPDPEKRLFLAAVNHLDHAIGEVIKALDETNQRGNTLILFSSDNGPQGSWPGKAYPDDLKLTDFNQPHSMRGMKCDVWEGGIRVPGFAHWPGHIKPQTITEPVHIIDWLPTLTKLVERPGEEKTAFDGVDLSPLLFETGKLPQRDLYWIWHPKTSRWALRSGDWKIVRYSTVEPKHAADWQLFNLKADPRESHNIANSHPDILGQLHAKFLTHRAMDMK
jgi:arylsulfatase A-like enzyme